MYEDVCYQKPFLKEVILRVDFSATVEDLGKKLLRTISDEVAKHFPITEPKRAFAEQVQFSVREMHRVRSEFTIWNFFGLEREKQLSIGPDHVFAKYKRYKSYEQLLDDFLAVLNSIMAAYPDTRGQRVGLRYINQIELQLADAFAWQEFINAGMLGLFSHFTDRQHLNRVFHIVEFLYDDVNVKYQFGMHNEDFPAPIKKPMFILDLDGYVNGSQDVGELSSNIGRAHKRIQTLFEDSITDKLREHMNGQ